MGNIMFYQCNLCVLIITILIPCLSMGYGNNNKPTKNCNLEPGHADSYLLSLGWQETFCSSSRYHQSKKECQKNFRPWKYQQFILHGLWPNQDACGIDYGYCDKSIVQQKVFCNYPMFKIDEENLKKLNLQMPAANTEDCLERHEWYKHGNCQTMSPDKYFLTAVRFTREINESKFGKYIRGNIGNEITLKSLLREFEKSFGKNSSRKLYVACYNNYLMSLNLPLPTITEKNANENLIRLIKQAPNSNHKNDCSKQLTIMAAPLPDNTDYTPLNE